MSYDKAKHIVEVDEKILAVFIVDSTEKIQELFIAKDSDIDRSIVESVKSILDLIGKRHRIYLLGNHIWDLSEYDNI
jgi:hypothetical protein